MPIKWTISHAEKRVLIKTEGAVGLPDVEAYLDDLVTKGAMGYAKLFDASEISPVASDHDVMMLGARMQAYISTLKGGPLAFVVATPEARLIVERYINLAAGAERPVRVFKTAAEAAAWLDSLNEEGGL
jgi:hypothetical protein